MKHVRLGVLACAVLAVLTGCAGMHGLEGFSWGTDLKETTIADAKLALQWAQEDQDVLSAACWTAIVDILQTTQLPVFDRKPIGVLTTWQIGRGVRHDVEGLGTSELRNKFLLGCSALKTDERDLLIKLGIKFAH